MYNEFAFAKQLEQQGIPTAQAFVHAATPVNRFPAKHSGLHRQLVNGNMQCAALWLAYQANQLERAKGATRKKTSLAPRFIFKRITDDGCTVLYGSLLHPS